MAIFEFIHIDEFSSTPKYRQLANSIIEAIQKNKLKNILILLILLVDVSKAQQTHTDYEDYKICNYQGI